MKDRIIINKDIVPYTFDILLAETWYTIEVKYNEYADLFTIELYKDGKCLCSGEPIVYGKPLFVDVYNPEFPKLSIIPVDEAGNTSVVTWENFGETVFLSIYDDEDDTIPYNGNFDENDIALNEENLIYESVSSEEKTEMETVIIEKGGQIIKSKEVATFKELIDAVMTIETGGGTAGAAMLYE